MRFDKNLGLFVALAALVLGGCAGATTSGGDASAESETASMAMASSLDSCGQKVDSDEGASEALSAIGREIYFDFDDSDIRTSEQERAREQAQSLATMESARVRIEGNADERGTREYNLALGERRAAALKEMFVSMGIPSDRIDTVSYGEECPAVAESSESAWAKNRRDTVVSTK